MDGFRHYETKSFKKKKKGKYPMQDDPILKGIYKNIRNKTRYSKIKHTTTKKS